MPSPQVRRQLLRSSPWTPSGSCMPSSVSGPWSWVDRMHLWDGSPRRDRKRILKAGEGCILGPCGTCASPHDGIRHGAPWLTPHSATTATVDLNDLVGLRLAVPGGGFGRNVSSSSCQHLVLAYTLPILYTAGRQRMTYISYVLWYFM